VTAQSQPHRASRRATPSTDKEDSSKGYDHDDPSLGTGEAGLTVWTLQKMFQEKRYDELDDLFDNGLTMNSLPVGMSAGAGGGAVDIGIDLINECLTWVGEKLWRGKIFFSSNNKRVSEGRNRMKRSIFNPSSPFVPMAKFTTRLLDSHPLAPNAKSNVVILNYADMRTKPYLAELLGAEVQAYDVQVAVKGKYGPVFVGKTWLGKYDEKGEFTARDPGRIVARYFLDFNEGALREQREHHWDGSEEEVLDPIPHVDN
jgi:hypothetical protein